MMLPEVLGVAMMGAVDALSIDQKKDRTQVFRALADAIVLHIQTFAQLQGIVVTGTAAGVMSGPAAAPVVGTGLAPPGSVK